MTLNTSKFEQRLKPVYNSLSKSELIVATYIRNNLSTVGFISAAAIGKETGVSKNTVGRLFKRLGYDGIAGLKTELQENNSLRFISPEGNDQRLENSIYKDILSREFDGIDKLNRLFSTEVWHRCVDTVFSADRVFITGFQLTRGIAEDFQRRLAIVKDNVQYLSPHDGLMSEFIETERDGESVLVLIDCLPYSQSIETICRIATRCNIKIIIVTDEFNHWADRYSDLVIPTLTNSGTFLNSYGSIGIALNILVHSVAEKDPSHTNIRLKRMMGLTQDIKLFS
ncbi:MAG TPA: hypothetical protein DE045_01285 [Oceanospirillaceae bacterium]|nr:hypothetical protein [Oceanospirillaceae bacterium]